MILLSYVCPQTQINLIGFKLKPQRSLQMTPIAVPNTEPLNQTAFSIISLDSKELPWSQRQGKRNKVDCDDDRLYHNHFLKEAGGPCTVWNIISPLKICQL